MSNPNDIKVIRKRPAFTMQNMNIENDREEGRGLLERLIKGLVDHPETIAVSYSVGERTTVYKVECDQKCLGQIIGSKGKNIEGVRTVMAATMARVGIRAIVEIPYFSVEA